MDIKNKFIELTSQTYPHGTEYDLKPLLPQNLQTDDWGNLYLQIGETPSTMFTCHLDTASYTEVSVKHIIKGDLITTDGTSILGADDKAGVVILLFMMEKLIPGLYYFFLGEERGCIGSRQLASQYTTSPISNIKKVVSFDRRGTDSVITHQLSGRCCSDEFAEDLSFKLNSVGSRFDYDFSYKPDPTGIYTDSAQFVKIFPECTNISVGYQNEHTNSESQDIKHLEKLCNVVVNIDWENLIVKRDPTKNDWYSYESYKDDYDYDSGYEYPNNKYNSSDYYWTNQKEIKETLETKVILDDEYFGFESEITYDYNTFEIRKVKISPQRVLKEKNHIIKMLQDLEIDYDEINWDGNTLTIFQTHDKDIVLKREELTEYLTGINSWIYENVL
jgi:hypothetical protein